MSDTVTSTYDVRIWGIEVRKGRPAPYRVRWVVAGQRFGESFTTAELADAFRSELVAATKMGERFDLETGLPQTKVRKISDVSLLVHAQEFTAYAWRDAAAKSRISIIETLSRVVPVVTRELSGRPDPDVLRAALRKDLNQGDYAPELSQDEAKAMAWLAKASRPVSSLDDDSVVWDVLDAIAAKLDGKAAAPDYFARRRRVMHRVLGYAVRKKRLEKNPLSKGNLPEGWTAPEKPEEQVDPRAVGSPALIATMLETCATVGRNQGPRFAAFFGCMYYAMMRPSEVAALRCSGCQLPATGWGYLTFADASTAAGAAYTDDGLVHEHRGLKGRTRGRSTEAQQSRRRPVRRVPIPPELVALIRLHIQRFGVGPDDRIFRSENGNVIHPSTWWTVWRKVRLKALTPEQLDTPLLRRPYDLRHSGVTWRLNSGVPAPEIAAWAGHSVEVLMRVYAKCMIGLEDVWIAKMTDTLHLEKPGEPD